MTWTKGDRVRAKAHNEISGTVESLSEFYAGTPHAFPVVRVRLDTPTTCFCGKSHGTTMVATPDYWEHA